MDARLEEPGTSLVETLTPQERSGLFAGYKKRSLLCLGQRDSFIGSAKAKNELGVGFGGPGIETLRGRFCYFFCKKKFPIAIVRTYVDPFLML